MATRLVLWLRHLALGLALGGTALLAGCDLFSGYDDEPAASCPEGLGWAEGLPNFFKADAQLPTTFGDDADDCLFHQWSWEAFSWATAEVDGKPRFMSLKTMEQLDPDGTAPPAGVLRLTPRSTKAHNLPVEDYDATFATRLSTGGETGQNITDISAYQESGSAVSCRILGFKA